MSKAILSTLRLLGVLALYLVGVYCQGKTSRVSITNNGYTDIVVAFHNNIKETEGFPLIQKIKELFSSGSHALYRATRQRSYFKQVTILVPKTWKKNPEYQTASYEVYTEADVRIEGENPLYGDGPYTLQPTPCGQPARYIHFTPNYLKNLNQSSTKSFGDPGKTLVHEWAHLRYGIFDEYAEEGSSEFPQFYIDRRTEDALPNACTNVPLEGDLWNPIKRQSCAFKKTGLPEDDCVFLPDVDRNKEITSSIASYHFLPNAFTFCDDGDEFAHNPLAPNRHNKMCNKTSTWSVITRHQDFVGNKNPPRIITDPTPTFKIVQQEEATYCLVLDVSGSMMSPTTYPKIVMLKEAASRWLKEEVKLGTNVGVVLFGNTGRVVHKIVPITSDAVKDALINTIPTNANEGTCIGCGLRAGADELKRFRNGAPGGIIVLLSDGEETTAPFIRDVQQEIVNANIRVITMAFTAAASPAMEAIAIATKGKQFSIPTDQSVQKLETSFHEIGTYQSTDTDLAAKIDEKRFRGTNSAYEGNFVIDATIGRDTTVSFLYTDRADIVDITISRPGWSVSNKSPEAQDIAARKQIKFTFKELPVETYTYKITRKGSTSQDISVSILSKSRKKGDEPIRTTCTIEQVVNKNPPEYLITAEVNKGMKPVIKAKVISKVDLPNGKSIYIELFDNGKRGDIIRDDGIYSGYFTQYIGKGRYSVSASVVSTTETAWFETGYVASKALPILNKLSKPANITEKATGNFQRVADAGSLQIDQNVQNAQTTDLFPPSQVTDLKVVKVADDNSYVDLEWTAPGDDLDNGQAEEYEIKYTLDLKKMNSDFYGLNIKVPFKPKKAGEIETFRNVKLRGFGFGVTYYIALKTKDDSKKWSDLSNIAEASGVQT